jgi:alkanesulfonate monooxygenase SsuD/methylene tetrahydromethanopterin reductase-like flavin-dependent oxidoreductase (luciferase family)
VAQLEDTLEIFKRLWTQPGAVTYHGAHYQIENAYCEPKPQPIPLLVGGGGDKTTRLAARFADIWNLPDAGFEKYNERLNVVKSHCADLGRDLSTLRLSWFGRLSVARTQAEAEARSNGKWTARNAFVGTPEGVRELLKPFIDAGVNLFIFEILGGFEADALRYTIDEVIARV